MARVLNMAITKHLAMLTSDGQKIETDFLCPVATPTDWRSQKCCGLQDKIFCWGNRDGSSVRSVTGRFQTMEKCEKFDFISFSTQTSLVLMMEAVGYNVAIKRLL